MAIVGFPYFGHFTLINIRPAVSFAEMPAYQIFSGQHG
jgi:hypothetical protein